MEPHLLSARSVFGSLSLSLPMAGTLVGTWLIDSAQAMKTDFVEVEGIEPSSKHHFIKFSTNFILYNFVENYF